MDTPQFIFELFEKELRNIQISLLRKVATSKGLDLEELINDFLPKELTLVPNTKTVIHVKKKNAPALPPTPELRCMARVWNRGKGGQCIRNRVEIINSNVNNKLLSEYCSQHEKNRKHGRIDEAPSKEIFPKEAKSLYK